MLEIGVGIGAIECGVICPSLALCGAIDPEPLGHGPLNSPADPSRSATTPSAIASATASSFALWKHPLGSRNPRPPGVERRRHRRDRRRHRRLVDDDLDEQVAERVASEQGCPVMHWKTTTAGDQDPGDDRRRACPEPAPGSTSAASRSEPLRVSSSPGACSPACRLATPKSRTFATSCSSSRTRRDVRRLEVAMNGPAACQPGDPHDVGGDAVRRRADRGGTGA